MSTNSKSTKDIGTCDCSVECCSCLKFVCYVAFWQPPPSVGCYLTVLLRFWGSKSTFTAPLFEVWTGRGFEVFTTLLRFFTVGGGHLLPNAQLQNIAILSSSGPGRNAQCFIYKLYVSTDISIYHLYSGKSSSAFEQASISSLQCTEVLKWAIKILKNLISVQTISV